MPETIADIDSISTATSEVGAVVASADSVSARGEFELLPLDTLVLTEADAPWSEAEMLSGHVGPVAYAQGIEPQPRTQLPGYDSGIMTLLLATLLLITFNFRHYTTFIKTFTHNLFSVRPRANAFDERSTVSEIRILFSLVFALCVCEGILLFDLTRLAGDAGPAFPTVAALTALCGAYYIFQLIAYNLTGYIFTSPVRRQMWLKGFNASQALLSLCLIVPSVVSLFNPELIVPILYLALAMYLTARLIFIIKGFRIFYNNYFSLIYFILYLCTLEIIPFLAICKASLSISSFI